MRDFVEFKKTIDSKTLDQWDKEILNSLVPQLDEQYKDDPVSWRDVFLKTYSFQTSMRLLEAYHAWLNG